MRIAGISNIVVLIRIDQIYIFFNVEVGAFHNRSTNALHPTTFDFAENSCKGRPLAPKSMLTVTDP